MNVATVGEESFKYGTAVLLRTIAESCSLKQLRFFILDVNLTPKTRAIFDQTVAELPVPATLEYLRPDDSKIYATLLRNQNKDKTRPFRERLWLSKFSIPDLLCNREEHVLFMDSDIYCNLDIAEIARLQGSAVLTAVIDGATKKAGTSPEFAVMGLDATAPLFNSGVMRLDLGDWKRRGLSDEAVAVADKCGPDFFDQSIFNLLYYRNWQELPWDFNYQCPYWYGIFEHIERGDRINAHYLTNPKPWQVGQEPKTDLFFKALDRTAYRGWRPNRLYWSAHVKLRLLKYVSYQLLGRLKKRFR